MAIASLVTVFQSVLSGTLIWKMSMAYGSGNRSALQRLAGFGLEFVGAFALLICPIAWLMRHTLVELSGIPGPYKATAALVVPWLITQTILGGVGDTFGAILTAHQRAGIMTLIQTGALLANSTLVICGLLHGWKIWSLLLGNTAGMLITLGGLYLAARVVAGSPTLRFGLPTWPETRPLIKYGAVIALGAVSLALRDTSDKVVLASLGNSTWTAWFGLAARLANLVLTVCSFFYVPLIAATAALHAQGDWPAVRRLYDNAMLAMPLVTGCFAVLIASSYQPLLVAWIGHPVPEVGPLLFILLTGNVIAIVLTGAGSSVCKGVGRPDIEAAYIVVCIVFNLALKFCLLRLLGPIGTVVSSAASWAIGSVVFAILLHRTLDLPRATFRAAAMIPAMAAATLIAHVITPAFPPAITRLHAFGEVVVVGTVGVASYVVLLLVFQIVPMSLFRSCLTAGLDTLRPGRTSS